MSETIIEISEEGAVSQPRQSGQRPSNWDEVKGWRLTRVAVKPDHWLLGFSWWRPAFQDRYRSTLFTLHLLCLVVEVRHNWEAPHA